MVAYFLPSPTFPLFYVPESKYMAKYFKVGFSQNYNLTSHLLTKLCNGEYLGLFLLSTQPIHHKWISHNKVWHNKIVPSISKQFLFSFFKAKNVIEVLSSVQIWSQIWQTDHRRKYLRWRNNPVWWQVQWETHSLILTFLSLFSGGTIQC